jgi:iron complex transport system ATP-binding protein
LPAYSAPVTATTETEARTEPAFRTFAVTVTGLQRLCPSVLRVTFVGDTLHKLADNGFDQRIKFFLPLDCGYSELLDLTQSGDWYGTWRELPDERRHPVRTYTARSVRPHRRELDVDIVLHGDHGPASRWASQAKVGDELVVLGPNADASGPHGGVDFIPPVRTEQFLIAGDETALPAIANILERLPADARGEALIEMPWSDDRIDLAAPAGVTVRWLGRDGAAHGTFLDPAVREAAARVLPDGTGAELTDVPWSYQADDAVWEVPVDPATRRALREAAPVYAWLAGESAVIRGLRRHLVADRGIDRKAVAFMGYWRAGRSEAN